MQPSNGKLHGIQHSKIQLDALNFKSDSSSIPPSTARTSAEHLKLNTDASFWQFLGLSIDLIMAFLLLFQFELPTSIFLATRTFFRKNCFASTFNVSKRFLAESFLLKTGAPEKLPKIGTLLLPVDSSLW